MPRAEGSDARERLLAAARSLGVAQGVSALTVQGIGSAAEVSKALVLYHFGDKATLVTALAQRLAADDCAQLRAAVHADDPLDAWRQLARDMDARGHRALLAALLREPPVQAAAAALMAEREQAASELAVAVLHALELRPKIATSLLGRIVLRQLDGLALSRLATTDPTLDAELDGFALALLALGR